MSELKPPADWPDRLRDHAQTRNLINGDSIGLGVGLPVATRLYEFFEENPDIAERLRAFTQRKGRV